ncbi:MAG: OprD family outer membrane porin [Acidiphilium sp.]|nr:OprD family outer membrane porin [Acidiphilium sp.]MDD4936694.1 OprD family outer membrane porin [Acidiphilium sp.]
MIVSKRAVLAAWAIGCASIGCASVTVAHAQTATDWFDQAKVSGTVRSFYFNRMYGAPAVPNQSAYSLAGILNVQSAPFLDGFEVGTSFFTAQSLSANNTEGAPGYPNLDATLMGPHNSITSLGQAFVQYQNPLLLVRLGDQELATPWMSASDSRVLPATYQAGFVQANPLPGLSLFGLRELRWKSRTSDNYYQDNLYYPSTFDGDSSYGGGAALGAGAAKSQGTLAFGGTYAGHGIKADAWYYQFYNFAAMAYGDASYTLNTGTAVKPFIGGQFLRETDSNSLLNVDRQGTAIDGYKGNGVDATAWGLQTGLDYVISHGIFGDGNIALSYNNLPYHQGAVGGGAIVSPFTVGYATDPLYTTATLRGLVELGPGDAAKIALTQNMFGDHVVAVVAFARFNTKLEGHNNEVDADLTYAPGGRFKGLSIRDRLEVSNASYIYNNGATGNRGHSFVYNRVMLQYTF